MNESPPSMNDSAMHKPQARLHVFSDYICPFCYIGSERLLSLDGEYDLKVNWCHVEIHPEVPDDGWELNALGYSAQQWRKMAGNLSRLADEDGMSFSMPLRISKSQKALLLAEAAKRQGRNIYYPLHKGIFNAYFLDGLDIGDEQVLRDIALVAGMDEEVIEDAWREQEYQERLNYNLNLARQMGIHSTPTYIIGDSVLVGVQPLERMREVIDEFIEHTANLTNIVH